ncbi:hypothetical protein [Dictyobacter vulcani]|uniref:hypothetical protein n=1 Tax=Dictyobacter vulcani TaxID=2607529 RepID=UPI001250B6C8|nr:hypothetical protein [Dictyobacter vulcani]
MKNTTPSLLSQPFVRTRFTWLAYIALGGFAFLQASPGPIVPFLHTEMHLNYTVDSLHMSAIALGMIIAGLTGNLLVRRWGGGSCSGVGPLVCCWA